MKKRKSRSKNHGARGAARSRVVEIPEDVAAAIKRCWPHGIVEEFPTDESYFHEIRHQIERDLRSISGVSLVWQTGEASDASRDERSECKRDSAQPLRDDDDWDEPRLEEEWQSYHVFFVSPNSEEFCFEAETAGEDPEDGTETTYAGEGRYGLAVAISLAAPFAAISASSCSRFEDGSIADPDPASSFFWDEETGEAVSANQHHRDFLGQETFQKLEILHQEIVSIMASHRIPVLDESVLDLPVKGLSADPEVFLEKPLRVRDALFFRGV